MISNNRAQTIQKTVPCICTNSKAEFSENLRPEGNLQFEKLGFGVCHWMKKSKCIKNAAFVKKKKEVCCSIVLYSSSRWSQKVFSAFSIPVTVSLSHQCHCGCKHTVLGRQPAFFWSADFFREVLKATQWSFNVRLNPVYFSPTITKVLLLLFFLKYPFQHRLPASKLVKAEKFCFWPFPAYNFLVLHRRLLY